MCLTCGDYSYPDAENRECIVDTCDSETEYLQVNGTCFTCEEGTFPNAEGNGCEEPYVPPVIPDPVTPDELPILPPLTVDDPEEETPVVEAPDIFGTRPHPQWSYVYTYTNKSGGGGHGNFSYPEYDIKTTYYEGDENYTEGEGENCPCDLGDWETGET